MHTSLTEPGIKEDGRGGGGCLCEWSCSVAPSPITPMFPFIANMSVATTHDFVCEIQVRRRDQVKEKALWEIDI